MPRPLRADLPGVPQHVVQRGNDRQPCFFTDSDYLCYRTTLREMALREGCSVHAYVLMTNHVHLLLTPQRPGAVARTLQSLGRRYVRYFNDTHHRSGTLWEGRYKACLVEDGNYLLQCHRYIELNPLRAAMVDDPRGYRWSSHHALAFGDDDPVLTPHPVYEDLSTDPGTRQRNYRAMVMATVNPQDVESIRRHLQRQHAYGGDRFRQAIEAQLGRTAGPQKIGRPRKENRGQSRLLEPTNLNLPDL
jgi:putative transposase